MHDDERQPQGTYSTPSTTRRESSDGGNALRDAASSSCVADALTSNSLRLAATELDPSAPLQLHSMRNLHPDEVRDRLAGASRDTLLELCSHLLRLQHPGPPDAQPHDDGAAISALMASCDLSPLSSGSAAPRALSLGTIGDETNLQHGPHVAPISPAESAEGPPHATLAGRDTPHAFVLAPPDPETLPSSTNANPRGSLKRVVSNADVTMQLPLGARGHWSDDEVDIAAAPQLVQYHSAFGNSSCEVGSAAPASSSMCTPWGESAVTDASVDALSPSSGFGAGSSQSESPMKRRAGASRRLLLQPDSINGYEVYRRLSAGSTADVFHAVDVQQEEECAIKAIPRKYVRYLPTGVPCEANIMWRLDGHPNVCRLRACIDDPNHDNVYLVLDLVRDALPIVGVDAVSGRVEICEAFRFVHGKHVLHNDVKPDNIAVYVDSEGQWHATVLDFGTAVTCDRRKGFLLASPTERTCHAAGSHVCPPDTADQHSVAPAADHELDAASPLASEDDEGLNAELADDVHQEAGAPDITEPRVSVRLRRYSAVMADRNFGERRQRATRAAIRRAVRRNGHTSQAGAPLFCAPEVFEEGSLASYAADVWSLGVVLYAALYGKLPFFGEDARDVERSVCARDVAFPTELSPEQRLWRPIIRGMLEKEPFERMHLEDVLSAARNARDRQM